jgi:hypothetical protein
MSTFVPMFCHQRLLSGPTSWAWAEAAAASVASASVERRAARRGCDNASLTDEAYMPA